MAMKRMVLEIGMGTDIRGRDPTKAAVRALRDALWHNSLTITNALGVDIDSMVVDITIGTPHPERVDHAEVLKVLPHGRGTVTCVQGEPPMVTPVVSARYAPVIVICEPPAAVPVFGAIELTEAGMYVNDCGAVTVPAAVVTRTTAGPSAPAGVVAVIWFSVATTLVTGTPPTAT